MRNKKKYQKQYNKQAKYSKIPPNAYKVRSKGTRRLAAATLALAVLGGGTTAAWIIHKVSHYNIYSTNPSATGNRVSGLSNSNSALISSQSPPSSPKVQTGGSTTGHSQQSKSKTGNTNSATPSHPQSGNVTVKISGGSGLKSKSGAGPYEIPNRHDILQQMMQKPMTSQALIKVPAIAQLPQLKNGCEVTSLAMLLEFEKHPVSKMSLAAEEPKDKTPLVMNQNQQIVSWGNPNVGFVGSVTKYGYAIYHGPLTKLVNEVLPGRGLDLTGMSFKDLEKIVANGTPVEVWDTYNFAPTNSWVTWQSPEGMVHATWDEHAVLLVGYNKEDVYVNNPLKGGLAAEKVPIGPFIKAWDQLGKQAITIAPQKFKD
ncbi:C39 family peptidase [Alicyclobacillus sp. SO9]|uniref:C39 family peptidase n=1 Tax=Alicyclobacillus sp. SO9 TaxID=2665646 RepID=UPI0018E88B31|nr:C39 family peptidase [Alicyclobacillus sp. SO9]QQE79314.1 C39 family peptidase [Alicyclobacillus sp. SO9]